MTIRLLLADDHTMVRQSVRRSMESEGFHIVGEAADGEEAVRLALELVPDVVLMDISMPVLDGVEATRQVRRQLPGTQVVVLTMHVDADVVRRALRAGAAGYLTKDCSVEEVAEAVRLAATGDGALSKGMAAALLDQAGHLQHEPQDGGAVITGREIEVLQLIAEGASPPEVADALFISVSTVKNHLSSIYEKLDARDRTQAVVKALRMGVIRLD
ncbi:MAG: response regulator transcription factor [Actinomycetota bacterium]|nr:response regulator transcription factor [Actinomycetota bacterium]